MTPVTPEMPDEIFCTNGGQWFDYRTKNDASRGRVRYIKAGDESKAPDEVWIASKYWYRSEFWLGDGSPAPRYIRADRDAAKRKALADELRLQTSGQSETTFLAVGSSLVRDLLAYLSQPEGG